MKKSLILIFIFSMNAFGSGKLYLKCLGSEEKFIHEQKIGGAYKYLNQAMIGELVLLGETIQIKQDVFKKLCRKNSKFASFIILEEIVSRKKNIFYSEMKGIDEVKYQNDLQTVKHLKQQLFQLFLNFLSRLQAETNDAKCLERMFPELKDFYFTIKNTQEDQNVNILIDRIHFSKELFKKLSEPNWKKNCLKSD